MGFSFQAVNDSRVGSARVQMGLSYQDSTYYYVLIGFDNTMDSAVVSNKPEMGGNVHPGFALSLCGFATQLSSSFPCILNTALISQHIRLIFFVPGEANGQ